MHTRFKKVSLVTGLVLAVTAVSPTSAFASDADETDTISQLVNEVRPDAVTNEPLQVGTDRTLTSAASDTEIPATSDGILTLVGDAGIPIAVKLPGEGAVARVSDDNTVVYAGDAGPDIAVQSGLDETRVHTIAESEDQLSDLTYEFGNLTPELNDDGSVTLWAGADDGSFQMTAGAIAAPWASDADGVALETQYRVEGNTVVQDVTVDERTVFPVVADPSFQGDCGIVTCTMRFNRAYTLKISKFGSDAGKMIALVIALGASVGGVPGAAAGAFAGGIVAARTSIFSTQAKDFYSNGNCFGIKFYPGTTTSWGTQVKRYTYNCR
ncbi:hypothetical protein [Demequina oxidasica]|uniref:hypothetical protein n=1 Tax=Demequina oxidasica TaxID=676199 RepID=UPI0007803650|nr:hypothetical protein [Demequina oxidasica]